MDTGSLWQEKKPEPLNEKPTLDAVRAAIRSALNQDSTTDRKPASTWLDQLKNSVYAWEICDQLLAANEGIDVKYLAAHMLRQKIARNFNELPLEYYSSLKDSIVNHLQATEDYAVQGQLTMAISDLTLLLQNWENPIEELAKKLELDKSLNSLPPNDFMAIYKGLHNRLLFAYILNNMCDLNHNHSERPCKVGAKRREEYEDYLITKCKQTILWWLNTLGEVEAVRTNIINLNSQQQQAMQQQELDNLGLHRCLLTIEKLVGQIYLCYSAWLRIFDAENVNDTLVLVDMAFRHLGDLDCPDLIHKYAVEAIVATANFCEDNPQADYLTNHLVKEVYKLEEAYRQSVAREDVEKSSDLVKVFSSVAEVACMVHVIENRDFKLLELLLGCLSHYDCEVVEETYSFWWLFIEYIQDRSSDYKPFVGYVNRFVMSITKMCQFDPDEDSVIDQEQDIHAFRSNSAEIITNVMFVTNVEDFLRDNPVLDTLRTDFSKLPWEKVEAVLYLLRCFAQMMTKDENHLRKQIFEAILTQQTGISDLQALITAKQVPLKIGSAPGEVHPQIIATSLQIIGSFESFLADFPNHLALAINYILTSISNPKYRPQLIKYAASALSDIMEHNAKIHFSSCPELLMIVKNLCANLDLCDEKAASELLKCSAFLASAIKESSMKDQFLCEIIRPNLEPLKGCLNGTNTDEMGPTKYLDRLSVLFSEANLHPSIVPELRNLISLIEGELWPLIVSILQMYAAQSGRIIERACRTIRYILRCLKPEWMIQQVAELMINLYKSYPHNSSPLYICSILVDEFANRSPEINQGLFAMLEIFCTLTFTLLKMEASQSQSLLTMKSYPETIDDMMRLFNRFLRKCPVDFVNCKALESIIQLSISSLRIDHPDANANVSKFVILFIELAASPEAPLHIKDAMRNVLGARITNAVIRACLFDIPTQLIQGEAEILWSLYSFDKDLFSSWIEATVAELPRTTRDIQCIESITQAQLEDFKKEITTAGSAKKIVNCLRAFARLYI